MIELQPIYKIRIIHHICPPKHIYDEFEVVYDPTLVWQLRQVEVGWCKYVCMSALAVNAREEDCSTPPFQPIEINGRYYIPQYVIDWMNRFAKVVQIGAAYGRSK